MAEDGAKPVIERLFVIRRPLAGVPIKVGIFAHSALYLVESSGRGYILEYGAGPAHDGVLVHEAPVSSGELDADALTDAKGTKWSKQKVGVKLDGSVRVGVCDVALIMREVAQAGSYDVLTHNCHLVQEAVRRKLELPVDKPFAGELEKLTNVMQEAVREGL